MRSALLPALILLSACGSIATPEPPMSRDEANARNGFGGYTGLQRRIYVFRGREFQHAREPDLPLRGDVERCDALIPWPEFDGGYKPPPAPAPAAPSPKSPKRNPV